MESKVEQQQLKQCLVNLKNKHVSDLKKENLLQKHLDDTYSKWNSEKNCQVSESNLIKNEQELTKAKAELQKIQDDVCQLEIKFAALTSHNDASNQKIIKDKNEIYVLQEQVIPLEKDKVERRKKLLNSHDRICQIYNFYKTYTASKVQLESSQIAKIEFSPGYYVKLGSKDWQHHWYLVDIKPDIINKHQIEKKLTETDDVQAFLACIYEAFRPHIQVPSSGT